MTEPTEPLVRFQWIAERRKVIAPILAFVAVLAASLEDGVITTEEAAAIGVAAATVLGVYLPPNRRPEVETPPVPSASVPAPAGSPTRVLEVEPAPDPLDLENHLLELTERVDILFNILERRSTDLAPPPPPPSAAPDPAG